MAATVRASKDTEPVTIPAERAPRAPRGSKQVEAFLSSTEKAPTTVREFFVTILYTAWMTVVLGSYIGLGIYLMVAFSMNEVGARWYFGGGLFIAAIMVLYPITLYQYITKDKRALIRSQVKR